MLNRRFALGFCLLAARALAGPQTWDLVTFDAPAWPVQRGNDVIGYTEIDQVAGTFCRVAVYNSQPGTGEPRADFAAEWKDIVAASNQPDATPSPTTGKTPGGLAFLEAGSMASHGAERYFYQLLTFSVAGRRLSVELTSGTQQSAAACRQRLGPFFTSLRVKGGSAPAPAAVRPGGDVGRFRGAGISGVWLGFRDEPLGGPTAQLNWIVLFDDGQFFQNLPDEGLLGFDRAASRANLAASWGAWSWDGSAGLVKKPGVEARYDVKLAAGKNGQLLLDGKPYFRCADVDGLRLEGSWTSYADPADPGLDGPATSPRPILSFKKDGRFVDEGVFATFLHSSGGAADAPGGRGHLRHQGLQPHPALHRRPGEAARLHRIAQPRPRKGRQDALPEPLGLLEAAVVLTVANFRECRTPVRPGRNSRGSGREPHGRWPPGSRRRSGFRSIPGESIGAGGGRYSRTVPPSPCPSAAAQVGPGR